MNESWFKAIRGNHEQFCIEGVSDSDMEYRHYHNGGEWLYDLSPETQQQVADLCQSLPVALEINYRQKKFGFIHADIALNDWELFKHEILLNGYVDYFSEAEPTAMTTALWCRGRVRQIKNGSTHYKTVVGVDEIYLGHTVIKVPQQFQNCFFIDTGAVFGGVMTIKELG